MPLRLAAPLATVLLVAVLLAGCGDSSIQTDGTRIGTVTGETQIPTPDRAPVGASARSCNPYSADAASLHATGISCDQARQTMHGWQRQRGCAVPDGASRGSCLIRSYRCQATRTDRGLAVSCARVGQSVAFLAKR